MRILIATDLSPVTDKMIAWARALFGKECEFHLLHVTNNVSRYGDYCVQTLNEIAGATKATITVLPGDPIEQILGYAGRIDCDMIIASTHDRSPEFERILKSVSLTIAERALCPVLVWRESRSMGSADC